jgi:hypothetical protein
MNPTNRSMHVKVLPVGPRDKYRRTVPKTYSYRYEIAADAGPEGDPLVRAGAVIIEGRYRGRLATWNIGRSLLEAKTYQARGGYVHPLEENPMSYPPRSIEQEAPAPSTRTPGFTAPPFAAKLRHQTALIEPTRIDAKATAAAAKASPRPTPANEPAAYRKTG